MRELIAIAPAQPGYHAVYADAESPDGKPYSTSPVVLWALVRDERTGTVSVTAFDELSFDDGFAMGPSDECAIFLRFASERQLREEAAFIEAEAREHLARARRREAERRAAAGQAPGRQAA